MISAEGLWRPPGVGRAKAAAITIGSDGTATVSDRDTGTVFASAPFRSIEISDRVGSIPRNVTFPDRSVFETSDNDTIDNMVRPRRRNFGIVHELERFRPRLILFVLLVMAFGFALYRYAVPALVEVAVAVTPPVVPQLMSKSVMVSLDQTMFGESELPPERQKSLSDQFAKIAGQTPRGMAALAPSHAPAYTLNFRKGGAIGPNAFALPDGTIVLTDELVELAKDDEMVLGVLAHEIGHVDREHSLRQLYSAAGATALIMMIGGDIGSGTQDILIQGSALVSLSYSRSAEAEADRYSVELMHKAGHDPAAITRFFELLRDKLGDRSNQDFLSSHPATPERIEETKRYAEEIAGKGN